MAHVSALGPRLLRGEVPHAAITEVGPEMRAAVVVVVVVVGVGMTVTYTPYMLLVYGFVDVECQVR